MTRLLARKFSVLSLLIGLDLCILLLYAVNFFLDTFSSPWLLIGDWSIAEILNYCKELSLFILALFLVQATRQPLFIAWGLIFIYLLADDALGLHELFGFLFRHLFPSVDVAGISSRNVGEFLFFALAGSVLLTFLWQAHRYSDAVFRLFTWSLLPWLGLLALFGVFTDAVHTLFMENPISDFIFTLLEDGGEMIVLSVMLWKTVQFSGGVKGDHPSKLSLSISLNKK